VAVAGPRPVFALVLLLIAVSCTQGESPKREVKGGDGVLRLSLPGEPKTLNPNVAPLDENALILSQSLFSKLVSRADDGTVLPDVAERWTQSDDGRSYTFYIRPGIRFHDGTPLTGNDIRATFARIGESANAELAQHIAGVDVDGDTSVTVRLTAPWAAFLPTIAWYGASILPAHVYGSTPWKGNPANRKPIGSGPFRFKSWEPGQRIVLEKFPDFFGQGPYVDGVEYVMTATPAAAVQLLQQGRVDLALTRPPSNMVRQLSHTPGLHVSMSPSDSRGYLAFNVRRPPFNDVRLRRAVNMALDRRAIVDHGLSGYGTPAVGFYTPAVAWAYNGSARVPTYDPAAARRLIADAGVVKPILFPFPAPPGSEPSPLMTEIIRQLAEVGLRVNSTAIAPAEFLSRLFGGLDFDIVMLAGDQGPDPDTMSARYGSAGSMQVMGYANRDLDTVLARGGALGDPLSRAAAYYRAQEILAADLPIAPLYETMRIAVFRDGIRGLPHEDASGLIGDYAFNLVRLPREPAAQGAAR
jgi:peptide/nickel transport system substrate-binding protein